MMSALYHRLKIRMLLATRPVVFFEALNQLDWYQQTLQDWVKQNNIPVHSKILEIGCATGILSRYIAGLGHNLTGVDLSESMIKVAQKNSPSISFQVADVNELPFETDAFDSVISASLLNIVSDRKKALLEMLRVCRKGGTISILVPLMGFDEIRLNGLKASLPATGFSFEALRAWHSLAPKMSVLEVDNLFKEQGLKVQEHQEYLNGMIFSVTAVKEFSH